METCTFILHLLGSLTMVTNSCFPVLPKPSPPKMPFKVPVIQEGVEGEPATMRVCIFQTKAQAKEWGDELNALNDTYQELNDVEISVHSLLAWLQSAHRWLRKWYMGSDVPDDLELFIAKDTKEMIHSVENSLDLLETKFPEEL